MANYYGDARSNYFRVKDEQGFVEWCSSLGLSPIYKTDSKTKDRPCGFLVCTDDGSVPSYREATNGEVEDIDFLGELSTHLVEGEVAVVMELGREKQRYYIGLANAVNSKGKTVTVTLDDIYKKAKKLGDNITEAVY